jgi:hypothetical protein
MQIRRRFERQFKKTGRSGPDSLLQACNAKAMRSFTHEIRIELLRPAVLVLINR